MIDKIDFSKSIDLPEQLAIKVLDEYFKMKNEKPSYPIDPFDILSKFEVVYQFSDFKDLEGIYIVPEDECDIALVGINNNRPIYRQRFTAAHELCHHIKDNNAKVLCPIDGRKKDEREKFADKFAAELLMPTDELNRIAKKYTSNGYVEFKNVIYIADYFGVSFQACVNNLAYKLKLIEGDVTYDKLKKRVDRYKPQNKRIELGLKKYDIRLLKNVINSYKYFFKNDCQATWYKFKNDFVYNENKLEGINIDKEDLAEILADLRMNEKQSSYCSSEYREVIEVMGHSSIYDYIHETQEEISGYKMLKLNQMLFQYAPCPEEAGKTRNTNNYVLEGRFETTDYRQIPTEIIKIDSDIKSLLNKKKSISISDYIDEVVKIHHKITVVHPFADGNGRVSRAILNWLFRINDLPPVYLKHNEKSTYYDALERVDLDQDYTELEEVFYRAIIRSMIQLNTKFII